MKIKIVFRADGSTKIGLGHIIRSLALAQHLSSNFQCIFAVVQATPSLVSLIENYDIQLISLNQYQNISDEINDFIKKTTLTSKDIVVLDGYNFKEKYQTELKKIDVLLIAIDDLHDFNQKADIIINTSASVQKSDYNYENSNTVFCLGYDYALLRREFLYAATQNRKITKLKDAVVCFGGADPNNLTIKILKILLQTNHFNTIHVIIGSAYMYKQQLGEVIDNRIYIHQDLSSLALTSVLNNCDFAICSSSGILLECFAVGIGIASGFFVDNQIEVFTHAQQLGLIYGLGDLNEITPDRLINILGIIDIEGVNSQIKLQKKAIDGKSISRIERVLFKSYFVKYAKVRRATVDDVHLYFEWSNDIEVRRNSLNQEGIIFKNHKSWFLNKITNGSVYMYLVSLNELPIGQVRFEYHNDQYIINYSIASSARGKGIGLELLCLSINTLQNDINTEKINLFAVVKLNNESSRIIFIKLGFEEKIQDGIINFTLSK